MPLSPTNWDGLVIIVPAASAHNKGRTRLSEHRQGTGHGVFQLVIRRYTKGPIILTSNYGFEEWGPILVDQVAVAVMIDHLVNNSHIFIIKGKSYRMKSKLMPAGVTPLRSGSLGSPDPRSVPPAGPPRENSCIFVCLASSICFSPRPTLIYPKGGCLIYIDTEGHVFLQFGAWLLPYSS